jgi:hypothetical protein
LQNRPRFLWDARAVCGDCAREKELSAEDARRSILYAELLPQADGSDRNALRYFLRIAVEFWLVVSFVFAIAAAPLSPLAVKVGAIAFAVATGLFAIALPFAAATFCLRTKADTSSKVAWVGLADEELCYDIEETYHHLPMSSCKWWIGPGTESPAGTRWGNRQVVHIWTGSLFIVCGMTDAARASWEDVLTLWKSNRTCSTPRFRDIATWSVLLAILGKTIGAVFARNLHLDFALPLIGGVVGCAVAVVLHFRRAAKGAIHLSSIPGRHGSP